MNSRKKNFSRKCCCRLPLHVYLAYLLVCTFLLTGVSFSRYISMADADDSARVAAGLVTVTYDDNNTILEMDRADSDDGAVTKEFHFQVSNNNSEVAIRYGMVLTLDASLPGGVTINLYKNDGANPLCTFDSSNTTYTVPDAGTFQAGVSSPDQYKLVFIGDFGIIGADSERTVSISVQAEQID